MRIAHVQPVLVGLVTGGVLAATLTGLSLAASAAPPAELAFTAAAASPTVQQCEPLQAATPSPSPTPTTPSPTPTTATPSTSSSSTTASASAKTSTSSSPAITTPIPTATTTSSSPDPVTSSPAPAATVSLCVAVQSAQSSVQRGDGALWTVTAWATGGDVTDATIRLTAAPASLTPTFSFGCGSHDGSTSCDLGTLDASSAERQLQAKVTVPASATTVTSVRLTAAGSATNLPKDPQVSAATTVTAAPVASDSPTDTSAPSTSTFPLSVGTLPYVPSVSPTLSPGGNASGLFPSLTPSADPASGKTGTGNADGRTVANTAALPLAAPIFGAQLVGLGLLALAFVLAVARLSVRRRPVPAQAGGAPAAGPPEPPAGSSEPAEPPTEPVPRPPAQQEPTRPAGDGAPEA